jgi:hypothetical protein
VSHVVFVTAASNIVDGDTNNSVDVFVRDRGPGQNVQVSRHTGAVALGSGGVVGTPGISADGQTVAFVSTNRLADDDLNDVADLYVHQLPGGVTRRLAAAPSSGAGFSLGVGAPIVTPQHVFVLASAEGITPGPDGSRVPMRIDLDTGVFSVLDNLGQEAFAVSLASSADGTVVAMVVNDLEFVATVRVSRDAGDTFTDLLLSAPGFSDPETVTVSANGAIFGLRAQRVGTTHNDGWVADSSGALTPLTPTPISIATAVGGVFTVFCDDEGQTCAFDSLRNDHPGAVTDATGDRDAFLSFVR